MIAATKEHIHKTIIETCYLDDNEKKKAVKIALDAGSEFIKTSTGFGPVGARDKRYRLIKSIVGDYAGIKAAGGIRTLGRPRYAQSWCYTNRNIIGGKNSK